MSEMGFDSGGDEGKGVAALLSVRHAVSVHFKGCNWSTNRAAHVRDVLRNCRVYIDELSPASQQERVR